MISKLVSCIKAYFKRENNHFDNISIVSIEVELNKLNADRIYNDWLNMFKSDELSECEVIRKELAKTIRDIHGVHRGLKDDNPYIIGYRKLFRIYEPYFKSMEAILKDADVKELFLKDIEKMTEYNEAISVYLTDLNNIKDTYSKIKYDELTSFL